MDRLPGDMHNFLSFLGKSTYSISPSPSVRLSKEERYSNLFKAYYFSVFLKLHFHLLAFSLKFIVKPVKTERRYNEIPPETEEI